MLLEGMSDDTKGFIDAKLRDLAVEKRRLARRLEELETASYEPLDADAVLRAGMASLQDLPRLMESASLEERKQFVHAFIAGVTVQLDKCRLDLQVRPLPNVDSNSSVGVVAGGGAFQLGRQGPRPTGNQRNAPWTGRPVRKGRGRVKRGPDMNQYRGFLSRRNGSS